MAQHDYSIANQSGAAFRSDLNSALSAIVSQNSGATAPSTTFAYQFWADTTAGVLKIRNAANNAWITLRELDGTLTIEGGSAASPGLYFTGDANTGIYSPAADILGISTGGVERLRVNSSGFVGIDVASPNEKFSIDVLGGTNRAIELYNSDTAVSDGEPSSGIRFTQNDASFPNTTHASIEAVGTGAQGFLDLIFKAYNNAEHFRLAGNSYLRMAASTGGIQFNGDTAAANALDDYEEGTWTPTIVGGTAAGTASYTVQVGRYTKVGNRIDYQISLNYTSFTGTGQARVSLPFASSSVTDSNSVAAVRPSNYTLSANCVMVPFVPTNVSYLRLDEVPAGGGAAANAPVDAAATLIITGTYEAA